MPRPRGLFAGLSPALALLLIPAAPLFGPTPAAAQQAATATGTVPAARRLPADTYGFFSIPDVTEFKARWNGTVYGGLTTDPALADVREQFADQIEKAGDQLRQRLGVTLEELLEVPSGEIAFAVVRSGNAGGRGRGVAVVAMLDFGESVDTVDQLIVKAEEAAQENGGVRDVQSFEGTEIVVWTKERDEFDDDASDEPADRFAYFVRDTHLVIGSDVAALEAVLIRWDGNHDRTLAGNDTFAEIADATKTDGREPALVWFADPVGSLQAVLQSRSQDNPQFMMAGAVLPLLRLNNFRAVGGSMDLATDEFQSVGKVQFVVDEAAGVLGLFKFPPADLTPPGWVSADAAGYFAANWDPEGAYRETESLVDSIQGRGALEQIVSNLAENEPRIDIKRDVIDLLTGRITVASYPVDTEALESATEGGQPAPQPVVVAVGVRNDAKASALFEKLRALGGPSVQTRDFRGTTIYEGENTANGFTAALAVHNGAILFATNVNRLEAVVRGDVGEPLSGTAAYRRVADRLPGDVSMLSFTDSDAQTRSAYELLRAGKMGTPDEFDVSALPPFEQISKYLPASGGYVVPDDAGAISVSFGVKAE